MTPAGTATQLASSTATSTIWAETQKRCRISGSTACCDEIDWPKSPLTTLPIQMPNCTGSDWSRPRRARRSARLAGVARSPSINWAGSPGINRIRTNTDTATISSVGKAIAIRVSANRNIKGPPKPQEQKPAPP